MKEDKENKGLEKYLFDGNWTEKDGIKWAFFANEKDKNSQQVPKGEASFPVKEEVKSTCKEKTSSLDKVSITDLGRATGGKRYDSESSSIPAKGLLEANTILSGRYKILELYKSLEKRDFYMAKDLRLDSLCIVKELKNDLSSREEEEYYRKKFNDEAKLLASFSHPNLPKTMDYFIENNRYFMVIDYIKGVDLESYFENCYGQISEEQILRWGINICDILEYLHSQNPPVIHRDIKPSNLFIIERDWSVILFNFDFAIRSDRASTKKIGTSGYAPPEQLTGNAKPESDIYSLGATIHYLLSGEAVVYKGTDLLLVRTVAIKVLKDSFTRDKGVLERFYREARAAAGLSHMNIVSIYDIGREDDLYFIVMEYMSNGTLENVMERKKELSTGEVIKYGIQVCRALDYSHQKRVIHRDIKPQNIMLTEENQIKVVDFGIARAVDLRDITQTGVIMGSAYYFSPEQASGKTATESSDIYSLGVLLYHMSSGRLPFDGNSLMELVSKHLKEIPKSPRNINPSIPGDLEKIIMKSMEKKPENRYASAQDLLRALQVCAASIDGLELENEDIIDGQYRETVSPEGKKESDGRDITFFSEDYEKQLQNSYDTDTHDEEEIIFTLDDLKKRKKIKKVIPLYHFVLFSLMIVFITGIILGIIWAIKRPDPIETLVSVPDIKGRKESQARASLEQWGLVLGDVKTEYSYDIVSGAIISQKPEAGILVKRGTIVSALVSSGSKKVIIPYVVQMNLSDAQIKLSQKGLSLTVVSEEYHEDVKPNYVISQEPPAGTEVDGKTIVKVVISKAREGVSVPELKGLSKKAAEELLSFHNLKLILLREEYNNKIKKGLIISQDPPAETLVEGNSTVKIILSSGPAINSVKNSKIIVPELLAKTLKDAKNTAEQLGFTLVTRSDEGNINDDMIVFFQSPAGGTEITKDKKVQVRVKSKVTIVEVPDVRGKLLMDAKNALRLKGLSAGNISETLSNDVVPGTVLQQEPLPKTLLPTGSSVGLVVSKTLDKSMVTVPSLVGMNVNEAKLLLEKKELSIGSIIVQPSEEQTGIILSQQPAGGMSVKKGTEINLIVSK